MDVEKLAGSHPGFIVNSGLAAPEPDDVMGPSEFKWDGTYLPAIDYVLVYSNDNDETRSRLRNIFLETLKSKRPGIETESYEHRGDDEFPVVFVKIYAPFNILAREAEKLKLEMALDKTISPLESFDLAAKMGQCCNLIEDDEEDFISGPFSRRNLHLFRGHENKDTFFRPSLRSYLVHNILINTDIGTAAAELDKDLTKTALPKLIHHKVFTDAFILHEPSADDPWLAGLKKEWLKVCPGDYKIDRNRATDADIAKGKRLGAVQQIGSCRFDYTYSQDERLRLDQVWSRVFKYQPLDRVRNYFGEKIAFYFAWSGHMITLLWVPTMLGIAIFIYGLVLSGQLRFAQRHSTVTTTTTAAPNVTTTVSSDIEKMKALVDDMLSTVKEAFDNLLTPIFAIIICLWGTLHTELWKRYRSTLAYEWDVNNYEHSEPDRPEFIGTKERLDPITGKMDSYYPGSQQAIKFATSFIVLLVMICVVFIGVAAVIVYRIFVTIRVCPNVSSTNCLILNAVISALLNAIFIIAIGKAYDKIAYVLTDWENHRTQSEYNNALILKLFAFQFANSYSSLFYIAFFRGDNLFMPSNGIFNLGKEFVDTCGTDGNCMSMLSFQVLILMVAKPMPKLLMDHGLPFLLKLLRSLKRRCNRRQVGASATEPTRPTDVNAYIVYEYEKHTLGNFTIEEYMEKIIQFGYLMLFAASFPLAPLIALLTNLFDISTDSHRMLWNFRRPVSMISSDIGIWHDIIEFLNVAGVISNACIIAFTASWVKLPEFETSYDNMTSKLAIVLLVENVVLGLKYFIGAVIPDTPSLVLLQIRRERYRVPKILNSGNINVISDGEDSGCSMASLAGLQPASTMSKRRQSPPSQPPRDFGGSGSGGGSKSSELPESTKEVARRQRRTKRNKGDGESETGGAAATSDGDIDDGGGQRQRRRHRRRESRRHRNADDGEEVETPATVGAAAAAASAGHGDDQPLTERSTDDEDRGYLPFGEESPSRRRRRKMAKEPPGQGDEIDMRQFGRHDTRDLTYF